LSCAENGMPFYAKLTGAKMMGYLADFLGEKLDKHVFEKARGFCNDNDKGIKLIMCNEILEKLVKIIP